MKKAKKALFVGAVVLGTLVIIFLIPVIINSLYKKQSGFSTVWSGADVLAYYGSLLGAIGTIVLGIVAYIQNDKMNKLNERVTKLQMRSPRGYFILRPSDVFQLPTHRKKAIYYDYTLKRVLPLVNISESPVTVISSQLTCNGVQHEKVCEKGFFTNVDEQFNLFQYELNLTPEELESPIVEIKSVFELENINGFRYKEIMSFRFERRKNSEIFKNVKFNIEFAEDENNG